VASAGSAGRIQGKPDRGEYLVVGQDSDPDIEKRLSGWNPNSLQENLRAKDADRFSYWIHGSKKASAKLPAMSKVLSCP
jgi:hypothetical protein